MFSWIYRAGSFLLCKQMELLESREMISYNFHCYLHNIISGIIIHHQINEIPNTKQRRFQTNKQPFGLSCYLIILSICPTTKIFLPRLPLLPLVYRISCGILGAATIGENIHRLYTPCYYPQ